VRHTLEALRPATQAGLPKLAREVNPLALRRGSWRPTAKRRVVRARPSTMSDRQSAPRISWLAERWAPRLLVIASGATITLLMIQCIVDWQRQSGIVLLAYPASLGIAYVVYRLRMCDLLVLAGACLSLIIVVPTYLAKTLAKGDAPGGLLFIAIVVIAMAGASGWWLKHVARET